MCSGLCPCPYVLAKNWEKSMKYLKHDRLSTSMMFLLAIGFVVIAFSHPKHTANGQYGEIIIPETPVFVPPPPRPENPFSPPIVVPTDVTYPVLPVPNVSSPSSAPGITVLSESGFPRSEQLKGSTDFLEVRTTPDTEYQKTSAYSATLQSGTMLLGVKKPSEIGMVDIPLGSVASYSNADVMVKVDNAVPTPSAPTPSNSPGRITTGVSPPIVTRITNLDGTGQNVRVNLNKGPFANPADDPVLALAPGYELVASTHKLTAADLRPDDGFARRNTKVFGSKGNLAVSQISVESILHSSSLIASMNQKDSGAKDRRILADMSKMAAVLNHVNGTVGYEGQLKK
jgi:hypothetical protein